VDDEGQRIEAMKDEFEGRGRYGTVARFARFASPPVVWFKLMPHLLLSVLTSFVLRRPFPVFTRLSIGP
jgi:hypothetical protein